MTLRRAMPALCLGLALAAGAPQARAATAPQATTTATATATATDALVARFGEAQRERARRGVSQVAALWRAQDGDDAALQAFVRDNFAGDDAAVDALFARFEHNLEMLQGHAHEINRELRTAADVDRGVTLPYDDTFAAWDPTAHVLDDFFANKLAFVALLNFPLTTLAERTSQGPRWTRRQWAETRLAETFRQRIPAEASLALAEAYAASERYIAGYNIHMHQLVDARGRRPFPAGLRLLTHWNLRDQIKADYAGGAAGLARQRMIQRVMERIVTQEIPQIVIDNPRVDWNPFTNALAPAGTDATREPDARYARLLANFHAQQQIDRYSPTLPTHVQRAFEQGRQLPEERVRAMLEQVLSSPEVARTAQLIRSRLGRGLEPFDIWYAGFRPRGAFTEAELDRIVRERYPTAEAYQKDIPQILRRLGFAAERADYVARHIIVEPARGSGHAMGAQMRGEPAHLRTRVEKDGMNYKGYNIAVHEMCHNVEQTFSLNDIDYYFLSGVPNTAFTEALAFTCQDRDLELLGLTRPAADSRALATLDQFWGMVEIGGVALVDMGVWRWMYAHPDATPAQLREAALDVARDVWNRWFAPVFGARDVTLLAIYSHMINEFLYLPDYPIGHMIAFQVEAQMEKAGNFGAEFERVARIGAVTPDLWMTQATGAPVGPQALIQAAARALDQIQKEKR
jgi:hypothetical protein